MMRKILKPLLLVVSACLYIMINLHAQPSPVKDAAELFIALNKLNVLGSVLYIAAHPDDENTAVLSYCSSGRLLRTGYLSLTRGDGGQNLIGSEQGDLLGVIRTEELLEARKIDGAEQFFSRAIDFGYSKSAEETMRIWEKEKILSDIVWIIRKFRPDVIITRFPGNGEGGHGNHTASEILAEEAFKIAGNPAAFPEQLKYVKPWQPTRIVWNTWKPNRPGFNGTTNNLVSWDVGSYNPLLGKSYTEIAARSRSMHKSQGFGTTAKKGESISYFRNIDGSPAKKDLFEDINTTWSRIPGGEKVAKLLDEAVHKFDPAHPQKIITILLKAYNLMGTLKDDYWVPLKRKELLEVIRSAAGIWIEAIASDYSTIPGGTFTVKSGIVNRSELPFTLEKIAVTYQNNNKSLNVDLIKGKFFDFESTVNLPDNIEYTEPYWLKENHGQGNYLVKNQKLIGKPENDPPVSVKFYLSLNGTSLVYSTPVIYRRNDPVKGEVYRPLEIRPEVTIDMGDPVYIFPDNSAREIKVTIRGNKENVKGILSFSVPAGWDVNPLNTHFSLHGKNDELHLTLFVTPPPDTSQGRLTAHVNISGKDISRGMITINYPHIPVQTVFPEAETKIVKINLGKVINSVGYLMGSGDEIPDALKQLGYKVTLLTDEALDNADLSKYDVIITGIRAYNTRTHLKKDGTRLLNYVRRGGTLIVQYSKNYNLVSENIGPYPISLSHDRVTEEDAEVNMLNPSNKIWSYPNTITKKDFKGWVQERGLYFADTWDDRYTPLLSCRDSGESPKKGGMLYLKLGKGVFIYTAYSWFRQLPAGVPGAYRIFVNLLSAGKSNEER